MAATVERPRVAPREEQVEPEGFDFQRPLRLPALTFEQWAWFGLAVIAFLMRIWDVGHRAMHHDESMHAKFAWDTFHGQVYKYNVYRHGGNFFDRDGRSPIKTPRKCAVRLNEPVKERVSTTNPLLVTKKKLE